jgi:Spy/CpxP family protein refolding chaperone
MRNAKLVIAAVFALTLCSGVVTGMLVSRLPAAPAPDPIAPTTADVPKTAMAQELSLNSDQQQKMQKIWENVRFTADECYAKAQKLEKEQWSFLVNLLNAEQKEKFKLKDAEFKKQFDELKKQREAAFEAAVKETDGILDETQRKRFHELVEKRVGRGPAETPAWLGPQRMLPGDEKGPTTGLSH